MFALRSDRVELADAWVEGDAQARWSWGALAAPDTGAHEPEITVLEIEPGCRVPRHTDSVDETIVVLVGVADLDVGGRRAAIPAGGVARAPRGVPHEVRSAGRETLRFLALYAGAQVVTHYETEVQPA